MGTGLGGGGAAIGGGLQADTAHAYGKHEAIESSASGAQVCATARALSRLSYAPSDLQTSSACVSCMWDASLHLEGGGGDAAGGGGD